MERRQESLELLRPQRTALNQSVDIERGRDIDEEPIGVGIKANRDKIINALAMRNSQRKA